MTAGGDAWAGAAAARAAGMGLGWTRVAEAVAQAMPATDVRRVWVFPPVRHEEREWGTAVIARAAGEGRVHVFTASYLLVVRGRERGQGRVTIEDVGESPEDVAYEVVEGVQARAEEAGPAVEIDPAQWFDDESAASG